MSYYYDQLEDAQVYQDYVAARLYDEGIVLVNFQSRQWQIKVGENRLGLEIKFDKQFASTHNLWIEVEERREATGLYVPSGIYRDDNSWLYGIGDRVEFFIFSKKLLRYFCRRGDDEGPPVIFENNRQTSRGIILPRIKAVRYADKMFAWTER